MSYLDPDRGRSRRDRVTHLLNAINRAIGVTARDLWASLTLGALGMGIGLVAHQLTHSRRRDRSSEGKRAGIMTGAPVHDVAMPIARSRIDNPVIAI
jgi:hypothetical protein